MRVLASPVGQLLQGNQLLSQSFCHHGKAKVYEFRPRALSTHVFLRHAHSLRNEHPLTRHFNHVSTFVDIEFIRYWLALAVEELSRHDPGIDIPAEVMGNHMPAVLPCHRSAPTSAATGPSVRPLTGDSDVAIGQLRPSIRKKGFGWQLLSFAATHTGVSPPASDSSRPTSHNSDVPVSLSRTIWAILSRSPSIRCGPR